MASPGVPEDSLQTNGPGSPPHSQRTNRLAIASLCCGIFFLLWPAAIVAIVLGHVASREIRRTGEHGDGLVTGGLTLGYMGLALIPLVLYVTGGEHI